MTASRFFITILFTVLFAIQLFAQEKTIGGKVVDSETKLPIPHVEVFISGTTIGCISDSLGIFKLKAPYFPCTLVADHVSYQSFIKPLNTANQLNIELSPSVFSINEINVSGKNKRKKNMRFFYSHFIPEHKNQIKILNDSVLVFQRDKMSFKASSNEALIVVNSFLGYKIRVVLEEFKVIALDGPNGKQIALNSIDGGEVMKVTGFYLFEPLDDKFPDKKAYYQKNRRTTYYGSYRHFLKSIYDKAPEKQGYEIEVFPAEEEAAFYQIASANDTNNSQEFVILAEKLKVNYHFDDNDFPIAQENIGDRFSFNLRQSFIYPTKKPFIIRENGTSPRLTFVIDGLMVTKSFANSLPEDYVPPTR